MSCFEPYASGIRLYEDPQLVSFTSMPSSQLPDPGLYSAEYSMVALEAAILCDGQDGGHIPSGGVAEPLGNHRSFTDTHIYVATSEQEEDSTDDMVNIFEGIDDTILWQPELLPAYHEDNPFNVEAPVNNPDIDAVLSEVRRSAPRTLPCYVRLVCACHRLRSKTDKVKGVVKKKKNRTRKRSVEYSKPTYPCEIRISKKLIPKVGKYMKGKAWLGTFATPEQRGRALDVGKYFLSAKKKKTFFDPNSEKILSASRDRVHALPLAQRVEKVIELAKYYGENGLLPPNLNSCE